MSISLGVGSRLPAYCASMGRVLLAALPDAEAAAVLDRSELQPLTPVTRTDPRDLLAEIVKVRRDGFSLVDEELETGLRSLAVPIRSMSGQVVAALNTGVQTSRLSCDHLRTEVLPKLLDVQRRLARIIA